MKAGAKRLRRGVLWIPMTLLTACAGHGASAGGPAPRDGVVEVSLLHLNDVYEMTPIEGGAAGGLARVATVRDRLAAADAPLLVTFGGDLLSPSAMGTARVDGARLNGTQMVAVMNALGLDVAVLGNHEFDIGEVDFRARVSESRFQWLATNVTDSAGRPFEGVRPWVFRTVGDSDGDTVRIAFVGAVLGSGAPAWVRVADPLPSLRDAAAIVADSADAVVALTHLNVATDRALLEGTADVDLVLGGHEHEAMVVAVGDRLIVKADANAVSAAHVRIPVAQGRAGVAVAEILPITDALAEDPAVAAEVASWVERAFQGFRADGFQPEQVIARIPSDLDGREAEVLLRPTGLTRLIADAFAAEDADADAVLYNAGSIRFDDVLRAGPVTEYDLIRVLPFGGVSYSVDLRGDVLERALDQGVQNRGTGGFLQTAGVEGASGAWRVAGAPLDPGRTYRVVLPDYLLTGRERGLGFLAADQEGVSVQAEHPDMRLSVKAELTRRFPPAGR